MRPTLIFMILAALLSLCALSASAAEPKMLPSEPSAEQILNGFYPFPPSPLVEAHEDADGFAAARLSPVPPPGVHPRILISPDDLPDLRRRVSETQAGRELIKTLRLRTGGTINKPGAWENDVFNLLADGKIEPALAILNKKPAPSFPAGHYQPHILYALTMESLDALISDDAQRGARVASAIAGYAAMIEPQIIQRNNSPLSDDVWRAQGADAASSDWLSSQALRDLVGYHLLGYCYDFGFKFMTNAQRTQVRRVIALATQGKLWMGARLPHHWRSWNWIAVGLSQPLLALSIEGEEGYDPRVFKLGAQIARDYLTYGISQKGSSTEAVGYTQFGLVWGNPFYVAAARRGDNLLVQSHHRAMIDWYLQSMEPAGAKWQSHGDGGDTGPAIWTLSMWKHFFPNDRRIDFLWQNYVASTKAKPYEGTFHIVEPLLWCGDALSDKSGKPIDYRAGKELNIPLTSFDPTRSSLNTRSAWSADATAMQFECRTDSVGASHEHADRGNFTFSALGRIWAKENFRSIETRHHNCVLIDGQGQGYWPGPGKWLGLNDAGWALMAACDAKDAYDWWWPKQIAAEDAKTFVRFNFTRWASYRKEAEQFRQHYASVAIERDPRPSVVAHFKGFEQGDPRMWDEDSWPVRLPHNPVQRAFRSLVFVAGEHPYAMIVDDIQKDAQSRLYEWYMHPGENTEMLSIKDNDIILTDATMDRDDTGKLKPKKGDRCLLVRVIQANDPADAALYHTRPTVRLEAFERKDTDRINNRTFGMDKRLVIPSRSAAPDFKIMLIPHRFGDALPKTTFSDDRKTLSVEFGGTTDQYEFASDSAGRTRIVLSREGKPKLQSP